MTILRKISKLKKGDCIYDNESEHFKVISIVKKKTIYQICLKEFEYGHYKMLEFDKNDLIFIEIGE
jgi:hypothetical protein